MSEVGTYSPATSLVPHNMDDALRLAEFMARARTVPKHLHDSPGDCLMVIEQAMRWGMSPFAVAQATSVISGKMMYEGKLVAAAVETSGAIVGQLAYEYTGEGAARAVTVSATRRGETNPRTVTVALKDAKTENSMWTRQPDQQLVYHGARVWARRWTPAVILGVYSREEMGPIIEGEAIEEPADEREKLNREVPLKTAASDVKRAPRITEPPPKSTVRIPRTGAEWTTWVDRLQITVTTLRGRREYHAITDAPAFQATIEAAPPQVRRDIDAILADTYENLPAEPIENDPTISGDDEVLITGADKVMAG